MLVALALALLVALFLGVGAYLLTSPHSALAGVHTQRGGAPVFPPAEFIFFSILALCYLLWSTLPLSIGSSRQFDPGNLLLYPVTLQKLFALDLISEVASLQSVFAIPAILALGIGAGLAQANLAGGILIALAGAAFGIALTKWISISIGSLIRKKRTRGETLLALLGLMAGLGGALFGQIAPVLFRHAESVSFLRWTPPGAIAYGLTHGLRPGNATGYLLALVAIVCYSAILISVAYWLSRRAILGGGRPSRPRVKPEVSDRSAYTGWEIPLLSPALSAVIEKEFRYLMRNAQVRTLTLAPLILIVVRFMNSRRFGPVGGTGAYSSEFFKYSEGLMATVGVLYVLLILAGLFGNQFALENAGMRTLILSPVERKTVLLGKNIALSTLALVYSGGLLLVNELVFRDLTLKALLFTVLSFFIFVPMLSTVGNSLSIRFPKRMKFGKRLNASGVAGLLMIPMVFALIIAPLAAMAAGYIAQSLLVEYATLAILAAFSLSFSLFVIDSQGELLQQRELEILEAVNDPGNE
jgi:hypothetical protein